MAARSSCCRVIEATAPVRICDIGGWTDTWFAGRGAVLNIAVTPTVRVEIRAHRDGPARRSGPAVRFHAPDLPPSDGNSATGDPDPLLKAATILKPPPAGWVADIFIHGEAPPGSSTGTSAAAAVALLAALDQLRGGRMSRTELATVAHRAETDVLGRQSGVQDQLASAYGGISYIDIPHYPVATVTPLRLPTGKRRELESGLSLFYVGKAHCSSSVHESVIASICDAGQQAPALVLLRRLARRAQEALVSGDPRRLGRVMIENTEAQARLHPGLVGRRHRQIIEIAKTYGACGWKVNGAGGLGGSLTVLHLGRAAERKLMTAAILAADPSFRAIPLSINSAGVQVRERSPQMTLANPPIPSMAAAAPSQTYAALA